MKTLNKLKVVEGIHRWDINELELTSLSKQLNGSYVVAFAASTGMTWNTCVCV